MSTVRGRRPPSSTSFARSVGELDRSNPTVDARLPDGSRVCAVIQPIAVDGPCLTIRRFAIRPLPLSAFAAPDVAGLLHAVVGGAVQPLGQRGDIVGQDDTAQRAGRDWCRRPNASSRSKTSPSCGSRTRTSCDWKRVRPRAEGTGEVTLSQLLRTALRMRPDRLVLGEVRGAEAVQLVQAMNTGHDGSMATVHANSALDASARVCSLVLQEVPGWPLEAIHDQVRRSIDVVIHVGRARTTERRVIEVCESDPTAGGVELRRLAEHEIVHRPAAARDDDDDCAVAGVLVALIVGTSRSSPASSDTTRTEPRRVAIDGRGRDSPDYRVTARCDRPSGSQRLQLDQRRHRRDRPLVAVGRRARSAGGRRFVGRRVGRTSCQTTPIWHSRCRPCRRQPISADRSQPRSTRPRPCCANVPPHAPSAGLTVRRLVSAPACLTIVPLGFAAVERGRQPTHARRLPLDSGRRTCVRSAVLP